MPSDIKDQIKGGVETLTSGQFIAIWTERVERFMARKVEPPTQYVERQSKAKTQAKTQAKTRAKTQIKTQAKVAATGKKKVASVAGNKKKSKTRVASR